MEKRIFSESRKSPAATLNHISQCLKPSLERPRGSQSICLGHPRRSAHGEGLHTLISSTSSTLPTWAHLQTITYSKE